MIAAVARGRGPRETSSKYDKLLTARSGSALGRDSKASAESQLNLGIERNPFWGSRIRKNSVRQRNRGAF